MPSLSVIARFNSLRFLSSRIREGTALIVFLGMGITSASAATDYGDYSGFGSASSTTATTVKIGTNATDGEASTTKNAAATSDNTTGTNDEDGVTITQMKQGGASTLSVKVSNTFGSNVYLNGWIDFNANGVLTDSGEMVVNNYVVSNNTNGATATFQVNVPATAKVGSVGARFRISTVSSTTNSTGASERVRWRITFGPFKLVCPTCRKLSNYNVIVSNNLSTTSDIEGKIIAKNYTGSNTATLAKNLTGTPGSTQTVQIQSSVVASGSALTLQYGSLFVPSTGRSTGAA